MTIIKELPEKRLERKFLEAVLVYEHGHCMEIAAQTKKVLTADDLKRLEEHERGALAAGAGAEKEKALKDDVAAAD